MCLVIYPAHMFEFFAEFSTIIVHIASADWKSRLEKEMRLEVM